MNLIDEQQSSSGKHAISLGRIKHSPDVLDPAVNGTEGVKRPIRLRRNQSSERGFAHARRPPKNHARQRAGPHGATKHRILSDQMSLSHVLVQRFGTHPLRQRCPSLHGLKLGQISPICTRISTSRVKGLTLGTSMFPALV